MRDRVPEPGRVTHPGDTHEELRRVFNNAVGQCQHGKGAARHQVAGERFEDQQIVEIGRRLGGPQGPLFQAVKKCYESMGMEKRGEIAAAQAELLGALNYIAAAWLLLEERA